MIRHGTNESGDLQLFLIGANRTPIPIALQ